MAGHLARKGFQIVPTIPGVVTLVFLMLCLLPGDAASFIAGENASEQALTALRAKLGLDAPLGEQYLSYLTKTVQMDLGRSLVNGRPVTPMIGAALPMTSVVGKAA